MENLIVSKYMRMLEPLAMEVKLELLSKLTENVKSNFLNTASTVNKENLLEELSGSWKDVDENIIGEIFQSRTTSNKLIDLE